MSDTNEPSPRPWRVVDYAQCPGLADVFDASGSPSGLVAGELKHADAALIVDAVNERDRLRDIVRRMMEKLVVLNAGYRLMLSEGPEDAEMADLCSRIDALVREARAAIGEGQP